jgi:hypothetical protein
MGTEYFLRHPWIGVLSNAPVLLGAGLLLLLWSARFRAALEQRPAALLVPLFLATRVVFLALVVGLLGHVSLDLTTYFEAQGQAVLEGKLPYRDFGSSYAPFFPFLMAPALLTPWPVVAIFLVFIACDALTLVLLARPAGTGEAPGDRGAALRAAWLYAAAPVTWYFLVRYGQDEALSALVLVAAFALAERRRETAAALLLGLGFCATKFTFGIFMVPFWLAARRRGAFLLAAALPIVVVFGAALLAGLPVWRPLFGETVELGFGPSVWRLPVLFTPLVLGRWAGVVLALALLALWAWMATRAPRPNASHLPALLILTGGVFLLLSPKVLPMYVTPFWPFVALWLARNGTRRDIGLAALLNVLLGTWWYFDAGGIQGMFGPLVVAVAVLVTAAIPVVLGVLLLRVARPARSAPA